MATDADKARSPSDSPVTRSLTLSFAVQRERQAKALGAAFLAHQVSELEKSVDTLTFSRDPRLYGSGRGGGARGGRGRGGAAAGGARQGQVKREVRVVDASVLVHALPVLKRWVREDLYQLVVPLSALSTLDVLKRSPPPLHDLARNATRFLETQLNIARQIQAAWSGAEADARIRLRAQASHEEMSWSEVEKLFAVPEGYIVEMPKAEDGTPLCLPVGEAGEEPAPPPPPTANDIPRHLRSTLQCLLYFHARSQARPSPSKSDSPPTPSIVLYNSLIPTPPLIPASLLSLLHSTSIRNKSFLDSSAAPPPDYLALSSGDALAYYLSTFFPAVPHYAIPSSEVLAATQWLTSQATAMAAAKEAAGGGGGRGGRGGGRGRGDGRRGGSGAGGRNGRGGGSEGPSRTLFVP
ncbi:hypothetical protein JCM21900_004866 [Sporobolomyces salmonicolor]